MHGKIPALLLLTVWRNFCSLSAHCMEKCMLLYCSLYEGISALFLLTAWTRSNPALCIQECLLSSCSLHVEIPALILLTVWRNLCSLPAHIWRFTCAEPSLLTAWRKYLLSSCSLYGGISALFLLTAWKNTCSTYFCSLH